MRMQYNIKTGGPSHFINCTPAPWLYPRQGAFSVRPAFPRDFQQNDQ